MLRLTDLAPTDFFVVQVVGRQEASFRADLIEAPAARRGSIRVKPGMHLRVEVVDQDGRPVAGAQVEGVLGPQWERIYNPLGRSDAQGILSLRHVAPRAQLRAFGAGRQLSALRDVTGRVGEEQRVRLRLGPAGQRLAGRLCGPDGLAREGGRIAVVQFGRRATRQYLRSGSDGRFDIDWLGQGAHLLVAEFEEEGVVLMAHQRFEIEAGETQLLELRLAPGLSLQGIARDSQGRPMADAQVAARFLPEGIYDLPFAERWTTTDRDGVFMLRGLLSGPHHCRLLRDDTELEATVQVGQGQHNTWYPRLPGQAPLRVQLVDAEDRPLSGWRVSRVNAQGYGTGSSRRTDAEGISGEAWQVEADSQHAFYIHAPLPAGVVGLRGDTHDYFATLMTPTFAPRTHPHRIRVPDHARPLCTIEGRVLGADRKPCAGRLRLRPSRMPSGYALDVQVDPQSGAFAVGPLSPGAYRLELRIPGLPGNVWQLRVGAQARQDLGDLRPPERGELRLSLAHADGRPVAARMRVLVQGETGGWIAGRRTADGSYRCRRVPRGRIRVLSWGSGIAPRRVEREFRAAQAAYRIEVGPEVSASSLKVLLPEDQERNQESWSGVLEVRRDGVLLLRQQLEHPFRGRFRRELSFALALEAGRYQLALRAWDGRRVERQVELAAGKDQPLVLELRSHR